MAGKGRKFDEAKGKVGARAYELDEAISLVQDIKFAKFDESVELAMRLGVNPSTRIRWCAGPWSCRTASVRANGCS